MNGPRPDVPIIGQTGRVMVTDMRVILPNDVQILDGGLLGGPSIAHLRVVNLARGQAWLVPLIEAQLDTLGSQVSDVLTTHNPTDYPRG